jgi:hypothetical protein
MLRMGMSVEVTTEADTSGHSHTYTVSCS